MDRHYELDVTLQGHFVFTTVTETMEEVNMLLDVFHEKFPQGEGYKVCVKRIDRVTNDITGEVLFKRQRQPKLRDKVRVVSKSGKRATIGEIAAIVHGTLYIDHRDGSGLLTTLVTNPDRVTWTTRYQRWEVRLG